MAFWSPDDFQKVRSKADVTAGGLNVNGAWDIEVLKEVPPAVNAVATSGAPQPKWLEVRAYSPDGETIQEGFLLQEELKPIPPEIDRDIFARACLSAAQAQGTNAEYLLAFADLVSKASNLAPKPSTACGPFQFTDEIWNAEIKADPELDLQPFDRNRPYLQPLVAASIAARAEKANPDITAAQLSMALLFGQSQADKLAAQPPATPFDAALREAYKDHPQGSTLADLRVGEDPAQLYKDPAANKVRTLAEVMDQLTNKLEPVFEAAEETLGRDTADDDTDLPAVSMASRLSLGVNEVYRDALLFAANRTNFAAAALAALINAEAAKFKSGLWNAASDATPHSSALGLTQFLRDTWLGEAKRPGTFLHQKAAGLDESSLLRLRTDPICSITAAAEYAVANLASLKRQNFTPESLTAKDFALTPKTGDPEANKAKLAYLAHHEGLGGALAILRDTLSETKAQKLLRTNNPKNADKLHAAASSWKEAYTNWLFGYIRSHIAPAKFLASAPAGTGGAAGEVGTALGGVAGAALGGAAGAAVAGPAGAAVGAAAGAAVGGAAAAALVETRPQLTVKAPKPGFVTDAGGAVKLTEAHLIGLWKRSEFPIAGGGLIVFGIRGCRPVDDQSNSFASEHAIKFTAVDYREMNCTIGQWKPGGGFALFPGSTVPFFQTVQSKIAGGGSGVNQLGPGRYPQFSAGFHQRKEGPAGHWALRQECPLTVQRTADDADFDLEDRWEVGTGMGDNIHCAFHMGPKGAIANSKFSSAGCQTVAGTVRKGAPGSARGPWAKFIAPFERGGQATTEYVLFPGAEVEQMVRDHFRGQTIVLRMGSQGNAVKELQRRLAIAAPDGDFGPTTFNAVIKFQTSKFGSKADDGIVDAKTAAAVGFELPFFDFDDAIAGGSGQSKTTPASQ